jgi:hypothetical protein
MEIFFITVRIGIPASCILKTLHCIRLDLLQLFFQKTSASFAFVNFFELGLYSFWESGET